MFGFCCKHTTLCWLCDKVPWCKTAGAHDCAGPKKTTRCNINLYDAGAVASYIAPMPAKSDPTKQVNPEENEPEEDIINGKRKKRFRGSL